MWIRKEKVLKLRSLYIKCGSPKERFLSRKVYISSVEDVKRGFIFADYIYHVRITKSKSFKLAGSIYHVRITKEMV